MKAGDRGQVDGAPLGQTAEVCLQDLDEAIAAEELRDWPEEPPEEPISVVEEVPRARRRPLPRVSPRGNARRKTAPSAYDIDRALSLEWTNVVNAAGVKVRVVRAEWLQAELDVNMLAIVRALNARAADGKTWVGRKQLARDACMSVKTLDRSMPSLVEVGLVEKTERKDPATGLHDTNVYRLILPRLPGW